jgi:uncharacterized protein (DUF1800 family)
MRLLHFAKYVPGETEPWDPKAAISHLLRRTGFGASAADIDRVSQQPLEEAVESLFDEAPEQEEEFQDTFARISGTFADFADADALQSWWCYRLLKTRTPLREKLTLFWHGHFTTSYHKVDDLFLVHRQCEMFRRLAWGDFGDLLLAVCKDPAMLVYLDGEANTKENPNENFARELLELFTLGIGHYAETDVRAAARALTGWSRDGAEFVFHEEGHDSGAKQFLGQKGDFAGEDIVNIILEHPALPPFIARKFLVFFACPVPPKDVIAEAAQVFQQGGMNIRSFLTQLFLSKFFYSAACQRSRIASPVEFVIGTARRLGLRMTAHLAREQLVAMGQELFAPPNVKGWDGEKKWINSSTWSARLAFAHQLTDFYSANEFGMNLDIDALVPPQLDDPMMVVDILTDRLLEGNLSAEKTAEIAQFLITREGKPNQEAFRTDSGFRDHQIRLALGVMLSLPEYHAY